MNVSQAKRYLARIPGYYSYLKDAGKTDLPRYKWIFFLETIADYALYGTSFYEFAAYGFYNKSRKLKQTYMTRRNMFGFFDKYNPEEYRDRLGNKALTRQLYSEFLQREQFKYEMGEDRFYEFSEKHHRIFIKRKIGWGGDGARIEIVDSRENARKVWKTLSEEYVVEPVLENLPEIKKINPDCLNTIKVVTLFLRDGPEIQSAIIRFGNHTIVDNVHSGGIAAGIDLESGRIETEAYDKFFRRFTKHPVTSEPITGFVVPMWEEVKHLVLQAASVTPELRYASWDIAVTASGPILIEGNWDAEFSPEQMIFDRGIRKVFTEKLEGK